MKKKITKTRKIFMIDSCGELHWKCAK